MVVCVRRLTPPRREFVHREFTQLLINKRFGADDKSIS